ncbi:asparagine synthase-related protein, partial [Helicobacter pullorum]|uniref:asparagine synthase-related protein n=1 Tax=Helicobacter pullorum TaxID=35818 RepID=UPI003528286D
MPHILYRLSSYFHPINFFPFCNIIQSPHKIILSYLLRKSCEDLLPKQIVWRYNKMGFESPQKEWLKAFKSEMLMAINHSRI